MRILRTICYLERVSIIYQFVPSPTGCIPNSVAKQQFVQRQISTESNKYRLENISAQYRCFPHWLSSFFTSLTWRPEYFPSG